MSANDTVLTRLLESLGEGVCLLDGKGRVTAVNQPFLHGLNPSPGLLAPGKPFTPFVDSLEESGEKEAAEALRTLAASKKPLRRELRLSGGRCYDCRSTGDGASGHIITLGDVSEQRRLEARDRLLGQ